MAKRKLTPEEKEAAFRKLCEEEFHRTRGEEWANGLSHLVGVILGIVALVLMVVFASRYGNVWHVVSCSIYGATLILLTFSSTMYHLLTNLRAKRVFQIFDHCTIYLLIAGTYTPYVFVTMEHDAMAWTIFGVEWALAICGIVIETVWPQLVKYASLPIYLIMGWMIVLHFKPVCTNLAKPGLILLACGGLSYTLGCIFYVMDRTPYMHTIWHVFVLGGIACQWVSVLCYVIPRP